jgi:hypothetical protein
MAAASPSLLEVQSLFLHDLGGGCLGDSLAPYVVADGLDARQRMSIYRDTSVTTLVNDLRLTFPAVRQLVGEEFFEGAARGFIERELPRSAWLDEYGGGFVAFLAGLASAASVPYLADVAALEWGVSRALHAPEATAIDPSDLAAVSAAQTASLRLVAHPALALVRTDSPADVIWHAVLAGDDAALGAIDLSDRPVYLLVERRVRNSREPAGSTVQVHRLSEAAWRLTVSLCAGRPLGVALEEVANTDVDPSAVLAEHLAAGRFVAFTLNRTGED